MWHRVLDSTRRQRTRSRARGFSPLRTASLFPSVLVSCGEACGRGSAVGGQTAGGHTALHTQLAFAGENRDLSGV